MVVKIYISGISGNKEVKKKQQRVQMILDSKSVRYEAIDITEPGREKDKEQMQTKGKVREALGKHPLPPQLFNDEEYCGDYEDFDLANEVDELEAFLHLPIPSKLVSPDNDSPITNVNGSREEGDGGVRNGAQPDKVNGDVELTSIIPEEDVSGPAPDAASSANEDEEIADNDATPEENVVNSDPIPTETQDTPQADKADYEEGENEVGLDEKTEDNRLDEEDKIEDINNDDEPANESELPSAEINIEGIVSENMKVDEVEENEVDNAGVMPAAFDKLVSLKKDNNLTKSSENIVAKSVMPEETVILGEDYKTTMSSNSSEHVQLDANIISTSDENVNTLLQALLPNIMPQHIENIAEAASVYPEVLAAAKITGQKHENDGDVAENLQAIIRPEAISGSALVEAKYAVPVQSIAVASENEQISVSPVGSEHLQYKCNTFNSENIVPHGSSDELLVFDHLKQEGQKAIDNIDAISMSEDTAVSVVCDTKQTISDKTSAVSAVPPRPAESSDLNMPEIVSPEDPAVSVVCETKQAISSFVNTSAVSAMTPTPAASSDLNTVNRIGIETPTEASALVKNDTKQPLASIDNISAVATVSDVPENFIPDNKNLASDLEEANVVDTDIGVTKSAPSNTNLRTPIEGRLIHEIEKSKKSTATIESDQEQTLLQSGSEVPIELQPSSKDSEMKACELKIVDVPATGSHKEAIVQTFPDSQEIGDNVTIIQSTGKETSVDQPLADNYTKSDCSTLPADDENEEIIKPLCRRDTLKNIKRPNLSIMRPSSIRKQSLESCDENIPSRDQANARNINANKVKFDVEEIEDKGDVPPTNSRDENKNISLSLNQPSNASTTSSGANLTNFSTDQQSSTGNDGKSKGQQQQQEPTDSSAGNSSQKISSDINKSNVNADKSFSDSGAVNAKSTASGNINVQQENAGQLVQVGGDTDPEKTENSGGTTKGTGHHSTGVAMKDLLKETYYTPFDVDKIAYSPQLVSKIKSDSEKRDEKGVVLSNWDRRPSEVDLVKQVRHLLDERDVEVAVSRARMRAGRSPLRDPHRHFLDEMRRMVSKYQQEEDEVAWPVVPPPKPPTPPPPEPPVDEFMQEVLKALNAPYIPKPAEVPKENFLTQVKVLLDSEQQIGDSQATFFNKERGAIEDNKFLTQVRVILDEKESKLGIKPTDHPEKRDHTEFLSDVLVLLGEDPPEEPPHKQVQIPVILVEPEIVEEETVLEVEEKLPSPSPVVEMPTQKVPLVKILKDVSKKEEAVPKKREIEIAQIFIRDNIFPVTAQVSSDNFRIYVSALGSSKVELKKADLDALTITVVEDNGYKSDVAKIVVSPAL